MTFSDVRKVIFTADGSRGDAKDAEDVSAVVRMNDCSIGNGLAGDGIADDAAKSDAFFETDEFAGGFSAEDNKSGIRCETDGLGDQYKSAVAIADVLDGKRTLLIGYGFAKRWVGGVRVVFVKVDICALDRLETDFTAAAEDASADVRIANGTELL
jgi:hypothetical protein